MKRFAPWMALLLLIPSLCFGANTTIYVDGVGGSDGSGDGSSGNPYATIGKATSTCPRPTGTSTNTIIRLAAASYSPTTSQLNPPLQPSGGGRYFIYGVQSDTTLARITSAAVICSTYVTLKWLTFTNGLTFTNNPAASTTYYSGLEGDPGWTGTFVPGHASYDSLASLRSHTRRRLRDTLSTSAVIGDLNVQASEVCVDGVAFSGSLNVGTSSASSLGAPNDRMLRQRAVNANLYRLYRPDDGSAGHNFVTAGIRQNYIDYNDVGGVCGGGNCDSACCISNVQQGQYVDSLRIWFSDISGTISGDGEAAGFSTYNATNTDLRGNHWTWHFNPADPNKSTRCMKLRDSTDNIQMNRDTVIATGKNQGWQWQFNVDAESGGRTGAVGSRAGGRTFPVVDSCYLQVYLQKWDKPLAGSYTYTTFITGAGLTFGQQTDIVDSLQLNVFNHDDFISTDSGVDALLWFGFEYQQDLAHGGYPWGTWTLSGTRGMQFKNNLLYRGYTALNNPVCTTVGSAQYDGQALVAWPWLGTSAGNKSIARKINCNWNLYAGNNWLKYPGDLSINFQNYGVFVSCGGQSKQSCDSKAGCVAGAGLDAAGKALNRAAGYTWKPMADSSADVAGLPAGTFDSLSVMGKTYAVQFTQYVADSVAGRQLDFNYVWTGPYAGTKLALQPAPGSVAIGAGEGGTDIGAVKGTGTSATVCVSSDTCDALGQVGVNDYSTADTTVYIRIINNGSATAFVSAYALYSPTDAYYVTVDNSLSLEPGQVGMLGVTIHDPSFWIPNRFYHLNVQIPTTDDWLQLSITINKLVVASPAE